MRLSARSAAVLAAVAAIASIAAAPAAARRTQCLASAHGHQVLRESTRALVYLDRHTVVGCWYRTGATHALPGQGGATFEVNGKPDHGSAGVDPLTLQLKGRFVGYGSIWSEDNPHGVNLEPPSNARVFSYDLAAGTVKYRTTPNDSPNIGVDALVLKANGSVAWMYNYGGHGQEGELVVKMDRATGGAERGLDSNDFEHGYRVEGRSLGLSADGRRIYWRATSTHQPAHRTLSAPLH